MGAPFSDSWNNAVDAAYFVGFGGSWPAIWLFVSIALCLIPLFVAHSHESDAYKRMDKK